MGILQMTATLWRGLRQPSYAPESEDSWAHRLQQAALREPDRVALIDASGQLTWREFDELTNRMARALQSRGIGRGDAIALVMENRVAFPVVLLAAAKLGAVTALINTNQRAEVLRHSLGLTRPKAIVSGAETLAAIEDLRAEAPIEGEPGLYWIADPELPQAACPDGYADLEALAAGADAAAPESLAELRLADDFMYIFTSGTTGLPKAALISHGRALRGAASMGLVCVNARPDLRLYNCLPLYHSTGLVLGFGTVLLGAASMFIRRRFSASRFLPEAREYQTSAFVYVGELPRYLMNTAGAADDADNPIHTAFGNGLRPDIWREFKARYGIDRVFEIYGASEGNSGFINAFNKDCTIGFGVTPHVLVHCDTETAEVHRGEDGLCRPVERGQPGLLLNEITDTARFEGYTDPSATESKIVRNVLVEGDAYFNTGDLVKAVDVGFAFWREHYQFVDRLGDTFRWRGENCSTNEVGEVINRFEQVQTTNVYGVPVPGAEGKAGMAAIQFDPDRVRSAEDVDWSALTAHVDAHLAAYARPVFIRVLQDFDTTSTFKLKKTELRNAGWDPALAGGDAIYVRKPGAALYEPLDDAFAAQLAAGTAGY